MTGDKRKLWIEIFKLTFPHFSRPHLKRNNLDNQQRLRSPKRSATATLGENDVKSSQDDIKYSNRLDIYSDSNENAIKINEEPTSEDRPPRLPPRPPPRPRNNTMNTEAGMIYSCRFFSLVKWCTIKWVNWKTFSPFFRPMRFYVFVHVEMRGKFE